MLSAYSKRIVIMLICFQVSLGISQSVVNNKPLFVLKVERHIIQPNGNVHQTLTVISLRGT